MRGGGDRGNFIDIGCVPDSTLKSAIDDMIATGTKVAGTLVRLTGGAAYEVGQVAADAVPCGKIMTYEKTAGSYRLLVRLWRYTNAAGNSYTPVGIANLPYGGTVTLGQSISAYATGGKSVKGGTAGWGYVIAIDTPSAGYCDVLF